MKKILRIFSTLTLLLLATLLAACGGPDEVYFTKDNAPRTTYVQGQELDFTGVYLTAKTKDKTEDVAMSDEKITISGYDKNTLGEQTVTVTYKELFTTFKVNVIPRMTFEGYDQNYFVGDTFNNQNGKIKVADDNAKVTTINLKDEGVQVTGFDSSAQGVNTLTVSYNGYTGTFNVNILDVEEVEFKKPTQKLYFSHETEFNTAGGYITVRSTGGIIEKTIPITADMVSGFDPSVATIENIETDNYAEQTVIITYLGNTTEFDIRIRYSGVSIFKQSVEELKNIDYKTAIDPLIGESAINAMNVYFDLTPAHKGLLAQGEKEIVARVAAAYAYEQFCAENAKLSHTFVLEPGERTDEKGEFVEYCGYFTIDCKRYEDMVETRDIFTDENSRLIMLGRLLGDMAEEFGALEMDVGINLDQYFATLYLEEDLAYATMLFEQMTAIYEAVSVVPEAWDRESIKAEELVRGIERAYARIVGSDFPYLYYPQFYSMISRWRTNDDLYDIIHTHYLYNVTYGTGESYVAKVWEQIPFPAKVNTLYNCMTSALSQSSYMQQSVLDTTTFMAAYREILKIANEIENGENQLYKDIYKAVDFETLIDGYIYSGSVSQTYSYINVAGNFIYSENFRKMWDSYFAVIDCADENGNINFRDAATAAAIENVFNDFYALSAYERFQFMCTLYSNYRELKFDQYAFDYNTQLTGSFIAIIAGYYAGEDGVLPEAARDVFAKLLIATEHYGIRYKNISDSFTATAQYVVLMDDAMQAYNGLSAADKTAFDKYVGEAYNACLAAYNAVKVADPEITAYPELVKLHAVLSAYHEIAVAIDANPEEANNLGYYALLFAAYESASDMVDGILASNDAALKNAYAYYAYFTLNASDEDESNDYKKTLETMYDLILVNSRKFTLTVTAENGTQITHNAVEYYKEAGFDTFFARAYDLLYAHFHGKVTEVKASEITALATDFRTLYDNKEALSMFYLLNVDDIYFAAFKAYFANDKTAEALFDAIIAYDNYVLSMEGTAVDAEALAALKDAWSKVVPPIDATLREIYDYYLGKYNVTVH